MSVYALCLMLFAIGLYAVLVKRNLIKIIIGIGIMDYAVNLFFVLVGYRFQGRAPIFLEEADILTMVDPLPQALVLTAIVIGLAVTALIIGVAIRIFEKYGTYDIREIRRLKG